MLVSLGSSTKYQKTGCGERLDKENKDNGVEREKEGKTCMRKKERGKRVEKVRPKKRRRVKRERFRGTRNIDDRTRKVCRNSKRGGKGEEGEGREGGGGTGGGGSY